MFNTHTTRQPKKVNNTVSDKRGFTLVELTIVIALVAVVLTMVVSFSALMSDTAADERAEYAFLEDVSTLKESLSGWVAENDISSAIFSLDGDTVRFWRGVSGEPISLSFSNGTFKCGNEVLQSGLDEIDFVQFEIPSESKNFIKCTAKRETGENISFVITLRSATTM